jgi:hypothetical protein
MEKSFNVKIEAEDSSEISEEEPCAAKDHVI